MLTVPQREKQANQKKLILSLTNITKRLLQSLEADAETLAFNLEQRENIITALKQSELVDGPIEPEIKNKIVELQNELELKLTLKLEQSRKELSDFTGLARDIKKYNLKNVR